MPATYLYPDQIEIFEIEQSKLPALTLGDPIFDMFPIVNRDSAHVMWEQMDDYRGLMQARGVNGPATGIAMVGATAYQMDPGRYSEFIFLDEKAIENRRTLGTLDSRVDLTDLVMRAQDRLLDRRLTRIKWLLWTLLATGIFNVLSPNGSTLHKDQYRTQTAAASVAWATFATATPLRDFRGVKILGRGRSTRFDNSASAYMNQNTMNNLLANTNANDLFGKRIENGATINSKQDIDMIMLANDLPKCVVWDDGYFTDAGVFTPYIPDNVVIIVGTRNSGAAVGEFQYTRNVMNDDLGPGPYTIVSDSIDSKGKTRVPRTVRVDDGFNGGPAMLFPGSVIILTV